MTNTENQLPSIGLIILAAGGSTRLGSPKQLLQYKGRSLLAHTCEVTLASVCRPILVMVGSQAQQMRDEIGDLPVQIVENGEWSQGMGSSIRVGVGALINQNLEAIVLTLCDQPLLSSEVINELVQAYRTTDKNIVASQYDDTLGAPALFGAAIFPELQALQNEQGAKRLFHLHPDEVTSVPFPMGKIDIDTTQDYMALQNLDTAKVGDK